MSEDRPAYTVGNDAPPTAAVAILSLLGKDYLSEKEAAHYACVSLSQFREHRERYGIVPVKFMGKLVYRRTDIQRAIELTWQQSPHGASSSNSIGRTRRARGTATA